MKKSKQIIYNTEDYNLFKLIKENRAIDQRHVKKLTESMSKKTIFNPILVNSKHEIIDGQHRLEALKKLCKPIDYTIIDDATHNDLINLNTNNKNWKNPEFLQFYVKKGFEEYRNLEFFIKKYKLSIANACCIIEETNVATYTKFRNGEFKFRHYNKVENFVKKLDRIGKNNSNNQYIIRDKNFILALIEIQKSPKFKWNRLLDLLVNEDVGERKKTGNYTARIQQIYNKGLQRAFQVFV